MEETDISKFVRVVDYNAGLQVVQGQEGRDFNFKGIHKLYLVVGEWTERFITNRALPNIEQLAREVGIETEQAEMYIHHLCLKNNPPLIKKLSVLEFDPANSAKVEDISKVLSLNTVFARPTNLDAGSAQRYINGCNDRSIESIKKALKQNRKPYKGDKFKDLIFTKIQSNRLCDTYASFDITKLFNSELDTKKEQKEATRLLHLEPILDKLVDDKTLVFFRNDKTDKEQNRKIHLYNDREEIIDRINFYVEYVRSQIVPGMVKLGIVSEIRDSDYKDFGALATNLLKFVDSSHGDQKTVLEELILLGTYYENYQEEMVKNKLKDQIDEILKLLMNSGKVVDINNIRVKGKALDKEMIPHILSNENILYSEYGDKKNYFEFILHKSCSRKALESARKEFKATGNDVMLRVLDRMGVMDHLSPEEKKEFSKLEMESLFKYLPFMTRLWRTILGNIYVTPEEAAFIRRQQEELQKKRIIQSKMKVIQKEQSRLAEERMKGAEKMDEKLNKALTTDPNSSEFQDDIDPNSDTAKQLAF
ncbi:MAG: hypothetical protein KDK45_08275, partial [Leptospiraceae bacterium]|nr:hypothetical protein [Leptospiraceae bacterium]